MGTGYSRNDTVNNIASGKRANAADIDGEFDALEAAFDESTGHTHDGTADEGGYVPLIADSDAKNKVVVDTSNNRVGVFVEVAAAATEQVRIQDGAVVPVTDDDVDLGAVGQEFKDLYIDGVAYIDDIRGPLTGNVTGNLTGNVTAASGSSEFNNITVNGTADFTNTPLVNVSDPTSAQEAATKNYVDTQIAAVIDTAPGTLDTLNELAAALGDDPDFATTVATSIGTKVSKAGDSMTGELAMGGNKITGLGTPTTGTDATTKTYVDSILGSATDLARIATWLAPDYANAGGTGDRTATVSVSVSSTALTTNTPSNLVNGAFGNNTTDSIAFFPGVAAAGEWILFDFGKGAQRVITEAKWYQSNTSAHGTWKWQGSNDGDTWADIGAGFTLGGAATQVLTELSANEAAYRFYRLFGVSGNVSGSPYIQEVEFKIVALVTEGFQRIESRFPDYFPTAKLAAAYFFDEGTDTEVPDVLGVYPIDLTLPTTPNVTRTGYGLKTELGLIQTPVLPNVRGQLVLYRTNKDGNTGFIVSGGPTGSGDGTLQQNDDAASVDQTKMLGFGLDPFQPPARRDDNSGSSCWALNRGGWAGYYRQMSSAVSSAYGLGGRHSNTANRCAEFETNCAFFFNDTLTDDEIDAVYRFLRQRAKQFGIYLHREDAPETVDLYMIFGESNADGRSTLSDLSAADQAADMRHTVIAASVAGDAMTSLDKFELRFNQQASDPANDFGPEFGVAAQRRADFLTSAFATRTPGRALIAKIGKGSTYIAPSANGIPVGGSVSWNASERESDGLFYRAFRQLYFTLQQALEQGIGFRDTVRVGMWIGLNDAASTSYVVDAATYQGYLQDWLDTLESHLPGLTLEVVIFRPHTSDPASDPTAITNVRTAIDAFAAANANVTSVDTDAYGLEADSVHYDAAASKVMGVILHG